MTSDIVKRIRGEELRTQSVKVTNIENSGVPMQLAAVFLLVGAILAVGDDISNAIDRHSEATQEQTRAIESQTRVLQLS